jgi:hypothetical protein
MQPGKKGIALSADEWAKLCTAAPQISQQLHAKGGASGSTKASTAAVAPTPAPAAAAAAGPSGAGGAGAAVELSGQRRADVSQFKGTVYCNIREYYERVGGWSHTPGLATSSCSLPWCYGCCMACCSPPSFLSTSFSTAGWPEAAGQEGHQPAERPVCETQVSDLR